ncbi:hypothetical protein R3P38DRAFT_2796743 [Favolaschia claudopus]|uniref:Uncharacterized protein n=1 Tax=Favolaschia claudopus TaxID=2862362 RepID=A0AAW0A486_9AGAR
MGTRRVYQRSSPIVVGNEQETNRVPHNEVELKVWALKSELTLPAELKNALQRSRLRKANRQGRILKVLKTRQRKAGTQCEVERLVNQARKTNVARIPFVETEGIPFGNPPETIHRHPFVKSLSFRKTIHLSRIEASESLERGRRGLRGAWAHPRPPRVELQGSRAKVERREPRRRHAACYKQRSRESGAASFPTAERMRWKRRRELAGVTRGGSAEFRVVCWTWAAKQEIDRSAQSRRRRTSTASVDGGVGEEGLRSVPDAVDSCGADVHAHRRRWKIVEEEDKRSVGDHGDNAD